VSTVASTAEWSRVVPEGTRFPVDPNRRGVPQHCVHQGPTGTPPWKHESIYRFFGEGGELLYVGITFSIKSRWEKHRRKPWWPLVRFASVQCFADEGFARRAEIKAIMTEAPRYNVARPRTGAAS